MINSTKNQKVAFSIALFSFGGLLLLLSSCFIYFSFYNNYIPPLASDAKVYFDYTSLPNAKIPISTLGLMNDQQYTFSLKLNVPNSPHNFGLGNFMVNFNLLDGQNNTVSSTCRPGLVTFKSPLLLTLTTIVSSLWLLIGSKSESQMIKIPLLELYSPSSKDSLIQLSLSTKDLHILEASLGIKTYLRGLRYFMYEWAFITGILMISLILVAQIAILWGIYETILTWDDSTTVKERTIKLKKKKSKLSRKSSADTIRLDSSYASYASRTVTPVNEE